MKWFLDAGEIYLHRDPVDFRKAINGLVTIIESDMNLSPYGDAIFIFCNQSRDKLKVIHFDQTGFVLWHKRLEAAKYAWPRGWDDDVIALSNEQLQWLLQGFDLTKMQAHVPLCYGT